MFTKADKLSPAIFLLLLFSLCGFAQQTNHEQYMIPLGGNTWIDKPLYEKEKILSTEGLKNWEINKQAIFIYVKIANSGTFDAALRIKVKKTTSLKASIGTKSITFSASNTEFSIVNIGKFRTSKPGYILRKMRNMLMFPT
jgi:hypothetical protein